jgi:hypothetical protein
MTTSSNETSEPEGGNKDHFLKRFLAEIAWPAMAGNVAWAFFSLAIDPGCGKAVLPRLGTLLALAL